MFAVIVIPDFSLQAALRPDPDLRTKPVGLVDPGATKPEIVQLTAAARQAGIMPGQTPSQAAARCGDVIIKARSSAQEASATEILLQTAYAFSPNIEATAPGICTMELKGLGLENGARQAWAGNIIRSLDTFYLGAQVGFGVTPGLALLDAHIHGAPSTASAFDRAVPVVGAPSQQNLLLSTLNPSPELLAILMRWGIRTIGELLALDKNDVAERLGPPALELFERLSPEAVRPLKLVVPPERFSEQVEFEHEIETAEPLLFVLRRFVEQLSRRLELIYLVVAEFELRLGLSDGNRYERTFKVPSPTGNIDTLFRMLQTHLETVRTDSPIVSLQLAARPAGPETHQFGLFESTLRDPNQFAETLARLTALVGPDRVGTPVPEMTHQPDVFRIEAPRFDSIQNLKFKIKNSGAALRRYRPPLPAHVEFRAERPALIRSEIGQGAIAGFRGPFFSSGNWWDDTRWAREEWDIETADGSLFRIFRSDDGCFVEGVYD